MRLDNPKNDAKLMAETLRGLGFTLAGGSAQIDLDKAAFADILQQFSNLLVGADVALFYYAGHGVQVRGANYLVPVNANPVREADVLFQMVDTGLILAAMEGSGTKINIVILDACRNNPFGGRGCTRRQAGSRISEIESDDGVTLTFRLRGQAIRVPWRQVESVEVSRPYSFWQVLLKCRDLDASGSETVRFLPMGWRKMTPASAEKLQSALDARRMA